MTKNQRIEKFSKLAPATQKKILGLQSKLLKQAAAMSETYAELRKVMPTGLHPLEDPPKTPGH